MRRPWQIWILFFFGLAIVTPGMGWLTIMTVRLEESREDDRRGTELARQEAELQERISSALYRMDLKMLPLIAREAARPGYSYDSFYQSFVPAEAVNNREGRVPSRSGKGSGASEGSYQEVPSPLMFPPPQFVKFYFQIGCEQEMRSPQIPMGAARLLAEHRFGVSAQSIGLSEQLLLEAGDLFSYETLLADVSDEAIADVSIDVASTLRGGGSYQQNASEQSSYKVPAFENLGATKSKSSDLLNKNANGTGLPQVAQNNKQAVQQSRGASRGNEEFNRRLQNTQNLTSQRWQESNSANVYETSSPSQIEDVMGSVNRDVDSLGLAGVMQPVWVEGNLILVRGVTGGDSPTIQVCWLDWAAIQESLRAEVEDLLPNVEFEELKKDTELNVMTALTTLPVQLVVDSSSLLSTLAIGSIADQNPFAGLRVALWVAWLGLALAAVASATLLFGVIRLSERRATFVSAVTHELRTPLTTFRMYAEMLAEKMVPPEKQQDYANTLCLQADRLSHLVENVLQFARLERGADFGCVETLTAAEIMGRFESRIKERAAEVDWKVAVAIDESMRDLRFATQPATVEQIVFNLVDNACKYARPSSQSKIDLKILRRGKSVEIYVQDYGPGVPVKYRKRMFQPFCKSDQDAANTAPGVGLGLALCRRMASSLGGKLKIVDRKNKLDRNSTGACFVLELPV
ncbi:MAG: HAMP domain-containing sensor histidine kinase [Mariniblastus sp.]|nr:HAMP domain-containing sensor histidine kinase [Mariniblastus sp.]